MYSLDPQHENRSDEIYHENRSQLDWKHCTVDDKSYPQIEMVEDKDNGVWIHRSNLREYLKDFENEMFAVDFNKFKLKLLKQLVC